MDAKFAGWKERIDLACHDCGNVMLSRDMFLDLHRMIEKNLKMQQGDYFHEYMRDTYLAHVLLMIRKHVKRDRDSISLVTLVEDILKNQKQADGLQCATDIHDKLAHFKSCAGKLEGFTDRVIAHRDKRPPPHIPTYKEVDEAIDAMDALCVQCSSMLGICFDTCKPREQGGWLLIFREMGIEI